jgi:hypothetical protein
MSMRLTQALLNLDFVIAQKPASRFDINKLRL